MPLAGDGHNHTSITVGNGSPANNPVLDNTTTAPATNTAPPPAASRSGHGHSHNNTNINVRAAFIHVVGDLIQSIGVLIAAYIIRFYVSAGAGDELLT